MGWLFGKKETEDHGARYAITHAFHHVKNDIQHLLNWIKYFHEKHQSHDERLAKIEEQLTYMPKSHEDIKRILDYYYSYETLHSRIKELNDRIESLEEKQHVQRQEKSLGLRERIVRKITRNSKDYVKSVILSMIKKYGKIAGTQLKEIIIDEQGLCSKSSFYRLLSELEDDGEISSVQSGKEKIYGFKKSVLN